MRLEKKSTAFVSLLGCQVEKLRGVLVRRAYI
jgi:hypothetical protein